MYAAHFGLREPPFNNTPDPRFFLTTSDHEEALACLVYAVQEMKGYVLLTGEVGAGKTLLVRMMLRRFGDQIASSVINNTCLDADDLLAAVCSEFALSAAQGASRFDRLAALQDYLLAQYAANIPVVLVLDEAQNLSDDAFEQIRMIGNLEADDAKLLQIVIVGQPELRQRFRAHCLRQLSQRLFRSFHLSALSAEETARYVRHRLAVAAAGTDARSEPQQDLFDPDALDVIHAFSGGLPRVINTACDNALLSAYAADLTTIDGPFMRGVVAQLEHGRSAGCRPSPVETPPTTLPAAESFREARAPASGQNAAPQLDSGRQDLEDVTTWAQAGAKRLASIYAAVERSYDHLLHQLADVQRPALGNRQAPVPCPGPIAGVGARPAGAGHYPSASST
jgi:general secretion pathway protein A